MQPVHGTDGAFVGGDWVPIEECADKFNISNGSDCGNCKACPRSRSANNAAKADGSYDVVIIGAGCIGASIARELSRTQASVLLLEASDDVTQGATKGNSGIVHAGYDDAPGSVRSQYCWAGNQMFPQLDRELHFGFQRNGSLVIARGEEDEKMLQTLLERGHANGVKNLSIMDREVLEEAEPHIAKDATAALHSPDAGTLIPYEFTIALAENAVDNGVELRIRRNVVAIEKHADGFVLSADHWEPEKVAAQSSLGVPQLLAALLSPSIVLLAILAASPGSLPALPLSAMLCCSLLLGGVPMTALYSRGASSAAPGVAGQGGGNTMPLDTVVDPLLNTSGGVGKAVPVKRETIRARYVVNAGGCGAAKIAKMVGDDSFEMKPRLGEYLLLNKNQGHLANHVLFPCPGPLGKGVLVQKTLWGNLILGPTARDTYKAETKTQSKESIMRYILSKCKDLVPNLDASQTIHAFAGARAKTSKGDWIIEACKTAPGFVHAAGIDSPGLAGSPAIALRIVELLREAGLQLTPDPKFNPNRAPIIVPKSGYKGLKMGPPGKVKDPKQNVVCKCEKVTEAEIVAALHRSLPVDNTQAIRRRTRAGMGHCQADPDNYGCEARIAAIIARETGLPLDQVGRRPWPATTTLPRRWLTEADKESLTELSKQL